MAKKYISIEQIFGGISPAMYFAQPGQYHASIGIDPDFPVDDTEIKTSGFLRPTAMAKFSGATVTDVPYWIITNPKDSNIYVYAKDGKVHSVSSALGMNSDVGTMTSSSGNGAAYYDNYLYLAKNTDISRYGPLDGSPSVTAAYWVTTLSKTALVNTTYPSIRGIPIPNHPLHRHVDNRLYIGDVVGNKGAIHYIKTSKTTVEGDTNNGSTYEALDLPLGYYPTAIETYGTDLAIAAIEGTNTTVSQKPASLFFWDTTSTSFQQMIQVEFPDPLITALKNVNGALYVWSGNASGGVRLSRFIGGYSFEEIWYSEEGVPPFQGAVDHDMNRIIWGGYLTYPEAAACVWAYGSKSKQLGFGTHNVFKSSSSGANQIVSSVKYVEHANGSRKRPIIGFTDDSADGLDKISTTYAVSVFRSEVFRVGRPFVVKKVRIPLAQAVAVNMTLIPKIFVDEASSSSALTTINNTNYANSERTITMYPDVTGYHNFFLELRWSGTALLTVSLPITIELEILDD